MLRHFIYDSKETVEQHFAFTQYFSHTDYRINSGDTAIVRQSIYTVNAILCILISTGYQAHISFRKDLTMTMTLDERTPIPGDRWGFSIKTAAEMIDVSVPFLRKEISAKKLKAKLIGGRVVIRSDDLSAYLENAKDWEPLSERATA